MEQGTQSIESGINAHAGFSLTKGIFLLATAMLVGFFMAYALMSTSGDFLAIDDVIQKGALNLGQSHTELRRREFDSGMDTFPSSPPNDAMSSGGTPDMTSFSNSQPATTSGGQGANPMSSTAESAMTSAGAHANTTLPSNTTEANLTDIAMTQANQSAANLSSIDDLIDNGTTAIQFTTTTAIPTTTPKPCFREGYKIRNSCDVLPFVNTSYGENVTLENIGHMLFKSEILDRLEDACEPGDWCLSDDWLLVSDDEDYLDFCYVGGCLRASMPDECLDEKRRLIISTLLLLCDSNNEQYNITDQCHIGMRKMTHVAMATVVRDNDVSGMCDATDAQMNCSHSCQRLAIGLFCMNEICNNQREIYEEYAPWQWFLSSDDVIDTCHISNETMCNFLMSPTQSWFDNLWNNLQKVDVTNGKNVNMVAGIIVSCIVLLTAMALGVWGCARKGSAFHRHTRDRVEYTQVQDEEDEFDTA